jgi:hypothetical protein
MRVILASSSNRSVSVCADTRTITFLIEFIPVD